MIKTVALVSLSAGTIGEDFVKHEVNIGLKRLEQFGLHVKIMPHAMKGIEYVKNHPKERANDLLAAICDEEVDMILCAIGGDDTYRLLPYLFKNNELKDAIEKAEKRKKARMIKKQTEPKKIEDQEKIRQMLKQKEEIMKAYIDSKEHKEVSRPKDYDEIRKEKIEKFNKGK